MAPAGLLSERRFFAGICVHQNLNRISRGKQPCYRGGVKEQQMQVPHQSGLQISGVPNYARRLKIIGSVSDKKMAKLHVTKEKTVPLPTFTDNSGTPQHLSVFLCQPEGRQAMLNVKALEKYEDLGNDTFRCYLPKMEFLNFEVAPVIDLLVAASEESCRVELLSCKFEGSDIVRSQNERFSASLKNHLNWNKQGNQQVLNVRLELNVFLEVYTLPFTLLPISAVESPGTLIMQAMVDRLLPLFMDQLFNDYRTWAESYTTDGPTEPVSSQQSIAREMNTVGTRIEIES